jgi:hypothetical protein
VPLVQFEYYSLRLTANGVEVFKYEKQWSDEKTINPSFITKSKVKKECPREKRSKTCEEKGFGDHCFTCQVVGP